MRSMHGIASLKTNDPLPASLSKKLTRLAWRVAILCKCLLLQRHHTYWSTQQYVTLLVDNLHTWMGVIQRAVDLAGLKLFIVAVLLFKPHDCLQCPTGINKCD